MKLVNYEYDLNCDINTGLNYLVVENHKLFRTMIEKLRHQILNEAGKYILSDGNTDIDLHKKSKLITDPFELEFNKSTVLKNVYSDLKGMVEDEFFYEKTLKLQCEINQFLSELISEYEIELEYDDKFDVLKFMKAIDLKVAGEHESFLDKIVIYMKTMNLLLGIKYFFFVNLSTYLEENEIEELRKECEYNEYTVVLIENKYYNNGKEITLIDDDLCRVI